MQVIGICRFSYLGLGGFQVGHDTLEERMAYLYAPARIEERFRTFETLTLPSLRAQTDSNYEILIVTGTSLPDQYMERLLDLAETLPQAIVVPRDPGRHRTVMQEVIKEAIASNPDRPTLQFRHDDDDAVALTFVERLREAARDCRSLSKRHPYVGLDFNRGFVARAGAQGLEVKPSFMPYWGVALGIVAAPGTRRTIMNFGHHKLNQFMPTVTYTDSDMYVRGHNAFNDSRQSGKTRDPDLTLLDAKGEAYFKQTFGIDCDAVRRAYSS